MYTACVYVGFINTKYQKFITPYPYSYAESNVQCGQPDRPVLLSLYGTAGPLKSPKSSVESLPKTISTYESLMHNT
jgi:hypothetical protein